MAKLRVGARGSRLSRAQTQIVADMLSSRVPDLEIEIVPIKTRGDGVPPEKREVDGKTAFTGEIEDLLLSGYVDAAVHSMKDLPVEEREGLIIAATPPRGDPRDALISTGGQDFWGLRTGAALGTSSLRRRAQLLALRSDLTVIDLHGNVETRIRKMNELRLDAVVLAAAGLDRISESARVSHLFSLEEVVPAAGQATLAVQVRRGDSETEKAVASIDDSSARREAACERAFTKRVGGDCFVPVGACARTDGPTLTVSGVIASPDGRELIRRTLTSTLGEPEALGSKLGEEMLGLGGERILRGLLH